MFAPSALVDFYLKSTSTNFCIAQFAGLWFRVKVTRTNMSHINKENIRNGYIILTTKYNS